MFCISPPPLHPPPPPPRPPPLLSTPHPPTHTQAGGIRKGSLKETLLLAIPSFFDLIATILMNIGLLSVTASVYQMMRGAEMLFAALFAVTFLKRHLNKFHYLGILCCGVSVRVCGGGHLQQHPEVLVASSHGLALL
jgi:drug/metabolite transporter (DMT)-like permease